MGAVELAGVGVKRQPLSLHLPNSSPVLKLKQ